MDPRFRRRLRPIASVVLIFFSWFCIEPWNFALAAQAVPKPATVTSKQSKSASHKFEKSLRAAKRVIEDLDREVADGKDITLTLASLNAHRQALEAADLEIQAEFAETEAKLKVKKLPAEILERHRKAVADYKANLKKLKSDLQAIKALQGERREAEKNRDRIGEKSKRNALKDRIKELKADLKEKVKDRKHTPLDPNKLPHRTTKVKKRKPRLKKEEFTEFQKPIQLAFIGDLSLLQLAQATPDLPTPQDLAETIEVQFTQEINDLAATLENNPVKIYNFVRNNIDFVPTWGSIQGADHCLLSKLCNAIDMASLLIAILRSAGISARYVTGTIVVPIEQVKNWGGGFSDNQSAVEFFTNGGIPAAGGIIGGQIVEMRMEHVWVEAYVDYIPSRGAVHKDGDTWIPLDPSFKQYDFSQTIDLQTAVPFDGTNFLNQVEATATIDSTVPSVTNVDSIFVKTTLEDYQNQIETYLTVNAPTATVGDVLGTRSIKAQDFPILPATLPYKKLLTGATYSEVPDALRHKLTFAVTTNAFFGSDLTYTASLPELAGRRITLSYAPATTADQETIDTYTEAFATSIPAYLVQFRPELKIDGVTTASGPSIGMATAQDFTLTFTSPSFGQDQVVHSLLAGDYSAVGLNLSRVSADMLQSRIDLNDFSEPVGEMLHQTLLSYWGELDTFNGILASQSQVNTLRHLSEGLAVSKVDATLLFGAPNSATYKSRTLDIARDLQTAIHQGGDKSKSFSYFSQAGVYSSALEGLVLDQVFAGNLGDSVSAVRILDVANSQGVPIYSIDNENVETIVPQLQVSAQVKSDIENAVNAGRVIQVPQQEITHNGWTGVGYIVQDPISGAGAYLISGGLAGGSNNTGGSLVLPLPEIPTGIAALVVRILTNSSGLALGQVPVLGSTTMAISIPLPLPVPGVETILTVIGLIILAIMIFDLVQKLVDKIPPLFQTFRHYTTFSNAQSIWNALPPRTIFTSEFGGDLLFPGVYLTDLFIPPDTLEARIFIANTLQIPPDAPDPNRVSSYIDVDIDRHRVAIIHFPALFPHQFLRPFFDLTEDGKKILFVSPGPFAP
ncbi:hypothetical protein JYT87_02000 [Nitrospira defluvii]|nr:hypothetical protein [Nitrospira defluvii]